MTLPTPDLSSPTPLTTTVDAAARGDFTQATPLEIGDLNLESYQRKINERKERPSEKSHDDNEDSRTKVYEGLPE